MPVYYIIHKLLFISLECVYFTSIFFSVAAERIFLSFSHVTPVVF